MPAVVSGPGQFSQRSDAQGQPIRDLPDPKYGEAQAYREQQKAAPLSDSAKSAVPNATPAPSKMPVAPSSGSQPAPPKALPGLFDAGSPDVPVTAGAPSGPGPNSVSGMPVGSGPDFNETALREALEPYAAADPSGMLMDTIHQLAERGMW